VLESANPAKFHQKGWDKYGGSLNMAKNAECLQIAQIKSIWDKKLGFRNVRDDYFHRVGQMW
jgi:hypothetical protein